MKHKIFISYSRAADLAHARVLYERLQSLDYAVFWDVHERIQAVDDWRAEVRADLKASSVVIVCLSRSYLASAACRQEMEYAASARKLLPIALEAVEWDAWPPQALSACNAVAMVEFESDEFWGWLRQELADAFGVAPPRALTADSHPAADAEERDDLVDWISKTPLQLMQTAGREAALDADALHAVDRFLFYPESNPIADIEAALATATVKSKVLDALRAQALEASNTETTTRQAALMDACRLLAEQMVAKEQELARELELAARNHDVDNANHSPQRRRRRAARSREASKVMRRLEERAAGSVQMLRHSLAEVAEQERGRSEVALYWGHSGVEALEDDEAMSMSAARAFYVKTLYKFEIEAETMCRGAELAYKKALAAEFRRKTSVSAFRLVPSVASALLCLLPMGVKAAARDKKD